MVVVIIITMIKLDARQKQLVIERLRELKAHPGLLAKYDKDGDGVVTDEEWEQARRDVIRQVLAQQSSRVFQVAPILKQQNRSGLSAWMYDHRELIGAICIALGSAMILVDPGTFAPRPELPYQWGEQGTLGDARLAILWVNWTSSGWTGVVTIIFGFVWSRFARYFID
ncbi:MAG: hypothetical protein HY751_00830 [Nitrospinae bacterium]|nr:hypothetical protein [Nitrospinota bacterium]